MVLIERPTIYLPQKWICQLYLVFHYVIAISIKSAVAMKKQCVTFALDFFELIFSPSFRLFCYANVITSLVFDIWVQKLVPMQFLQGLSSKNIPITQFHLFCNANIITSLVFDIWVQKLVCKAFPQRIFKSNAWWKVKYMKYIGISFTINQPTNQQY